MLNRLQILIHPIIFLVEGEIHQFEAVSELEHGVVSDGTATSAVKSGSLAKLFAYLLKHVHRHLGIGSGAGVSGVHYYFFRLDEAIVHGYLHRRRAADARRQNNKKKRVTSKSYWTFLDTSFVLPPLLTQPETGSRAIRYPIEATPRVVMAMSASLTRTG